MTEESDGVWRRDEVDSPCIRVCTIHPRTGFCLGCHRTGDEIAAWSRLSPERRRQIMGELPEREAAPGRRAGGRAARRGRR